jgi:hypothetical protein
MGKLLLAVFICTSISLYLLGCTGHDSEHPSHEHPSEEKAASEHPSGEHPSEEKAASEHPSGEHPSEEKA